MGVHRCKGMLPWQPFLSFYIRGIHWCHLANTTEPYVCGGDAALCQITLTTYYYPREAMLAVNMLWSCVRRLSQAGVLWCISRRLNESSSFSTRRHQHPTQCYNGTVLSSTIWVLLSATLSQTLNLSDFLLEFTFAICYRPSVCRLSVTLVRPTQAVEIFGNIFTALGTLAIHWHPQKILRRSSQGNPSAGGVEHKRGSKI